MELSDGELRQFRIELEQLRDELNQAVRAAQRDAETVDLDQPIGRLSRIDAIQQQQMASERTRRHEIRLTQINRALAALEEGLFGECRSCGELIATKRLRARPESPFCIECQQRLGG